MRNKYVDLSIEEQLLRYKKENKALLISAIICTIFIIAVAIIFFAYELDRTVAIGILLCLPFSLWIGYYIPKKENSKKIEELNKDSDILSK